VNIARKTQRRRYISTEISCNAYIGSNELEQHCSLSPKCEQLMRNAFSRLSMTARSYDRTLRVARTIADLDNMENIEVKHLAEAIQYRFQGFQ
jgi:magnesium chelatase family protein